MPHEFLVGLQVADQAMYSQYRHAMGPILKAYGGGFRYDFSVDAVLKSPDMAPVNRLFVIGFPDADQAQAFFSDDRYLAIKREYFDPAVTSQTIMARFDSPAT